MMPRMIVLFWIENDTPFSQQRLQKRLYHTQTRNAPFIRNSRTAETETFTPPEAKGSHRSGKICRLLSFSNTPSIRTLSTILKNGQDKAQEQKSQKEPVQHGITRGADYFRKGGSSR